MLKFKVKRVTTDENTQNTTVYLFNTKEKILLPIKMNTYASSKILLANDKDGHEARPHIHNTVGRIIKALKGKVLGVLIYGYHNEIFYSYLQIKHNGKKLEIDCKPSDAISISIRENVPIFVEKHIYTNAGIKVTKELLAKSL